MVCFFRFNKVETAEDLQVKGGNAPDMITATLDEAKKVLQNIFLF